eukprot:COSAG05_NODE_535_length_8871_cov_311.345759_6_plen_115_part_00
MLFWKAGVSRDLISMIHLSLLALRAERATDAERIYLIQQDPLPFIFCETRGAHDNAAEHTARRTSSPYGFSALRPELAPAPVGPDDLSQSRRFWHFPASAPRAVARGGLEEPSC